MPVIEKTVDAKPMPQGAVDESVAVPKSVRDAAAKSEAAYKQAYEPSPQPDPVTPQVSLQPDPITPQPVQHDAERASWTTQQWEHHAKSIEGRYKAQQKSMDTMQTQMSELGDELIRTQSLVRVPPAPLAVPSQQQQTPIRLLTAEDEQAYGPEMLDVVKRGALEAVTPLIETLKQENARLKQQVQRTTTTTVAQALDQAVPDWQAINVSPKFKNWLRLRDVYSGNVRADLLNAAYRAADAARVVAFFRGFLTEEEATGSLDTPLQPQQPAPQPASRVAAVPLETLTAPGRARPPSGNSPAVADSKPIITHAQIREFYTNVRKGVYAGRDQDKANDEAFVFECQREGRVR